MFNTIIFTIFCWWLIVFGFNQESSSEFGEHLDRNQIDHKALRLYRDKEKVLNDHDNEILEEFLKKQEMMIQESKKLTTRRFEIKKLELKTEKKTSPAVEPVKPARDEKAKQLKHRKKHSKVQNFTIPTVRSVIDLNHHNDSKVVTKWEFSLPPDVFGSANLGDLGKAVTMPVKIPPDIQRIHDKGWHDHQFNQYVSDLISVNRTLPDFRSKHCRNLNYSQNLPATSVIIIFHNEAWSTLLRSVHSVLNRSPEHSITEVILVDDFSDMGEFDASRSKFKL